MKHSERAGVARAKDQAKALLKDLRSTDPARVLAAQERILVIPIHAGRAAAEIEPDRVQLKHALEVIAREAGYARWYDFVRLASEYVDPMARFQDELASGAYFRPENVVARMGDLFEARLCRGGFETEAVMREHITELVDVVGGPESVTGRALAERLDQLALADKEGSREARVAALSEKLRRYARPDSIRIHAHSVAPITQWPDRDRPTPASIAIEIGKGCLEGAGDIIAGIVGRPSESSEHGDGITALVYFQGDAPSRDDLLRLGSQLGVPRANILLDGMPVDTPPAERAARAHGELFDRFQADLVRGAFAVDHTGRLNEEEVGARIRQIVEHSVGDLGSPDGLAFAKSLYRLVDTHESQAHDARVAALTAKLGSYLLPGSLRIRASSGSRLPSGAPASLSIEIVQAYQVGAVQIIEGIIGRAADLMQHNPAGTLIAFHLDDTPSREYLARLARRLDVPPSSVYLDGVPLDSPPARSEDVLRALSEELEGKIARGEITIEAAARREADRLADTSGLDPSSMAYGDISLTLHELVSEIFEEEEEVS